MEPLSLRTSIFVQPKLSLCNVLFMNIVLYFQILSDHDVFRYLECCYCISPLAFATPLKLTIAKAATVELLFFDSCLAQEYIVSASLYTSVHTVTSIPAHTQQSLHTHLQITCTAYLLLACFFLFLFYFFFLHYFLLYNATSHLYNGLGEFFFRFA